MQIINIPPLPGNQSLIFSSAALFYVHLMRNSLRYVADKELREVATNLKAIYKASTESEAELNLELFAEKWD